MAKVQHAIYLQEESAAADSVKAEQQGQAGTGVGTRTATEPAASQRGAAISLLKEAVDNLEEHNSQVSQNSELLWWREASNLLSHPLLVTVNFRRS